MKIQNQVLMTKDNVTFYGIAHIVKIMAKSSVFYIITVPEVFFELYVQMSGLIFWFVGFS